MNRIFSNSIRFLSRNKIISNQLNKIYTKKLYYSTKDTKNSSCESGCQHNHHHNHQHNHKHHHNEEKQINEIPKNSIFKVLSRLIEFIVKDAYYSRSTRKQYKEFEEFSMKIFRDNKDLIKDIVKISPDKLKYKTCQNIPAKSMFINEKDQIMMVFQIPLKTELIYKDHSTSDEILTISSIHLISLGEKLPKQNISNPFPLSLISPSKSVYKIDPIRVTLLLDIESGNQGFMDMKRDIVLFERKGEEEEQGEKHETIEAEFKEK